jgi:Na+/H+ antiporter NhaC
MTKSQIPGISNFCPFSGLVAMMEKSGGMFGFTNDIAMYAKTARSGQFACFGVGILVFFDDYANTLLAGKSLRPLLDTLFVSREKLAFIVDATAAPIASISPVSSWVGFEIGLIQTEIDRIIEQQGTDDIGIETSGFAVFLQSIKYRYYPIFMLVLMFVMIFAQRDFGTMLIAERKTEVYKRTDGGEAATEKKMEKENPDFNFGSLTNENNGMKVEDFGGDNEPRKDTPLASWNMLVPILLLVSTVAAVVSSAR